ncbi:hypothetical protein DASC09_016160 [Saccharomycopsis crataegensis]|uniref:PCI domain-containing protein n=1 Tax=Saccharomycopsis crataegensis TaxID=43959 RepID=A0AAV5QI39_9ASCO|nr:hypothetical protein DASC09_016160 [Saccharomycopsis crataegensis]
MSDNEDFMMSEEEEDPFEYEDSDDEMVASDGGSFQEDSDEEGEESLENQYYSAKSIKEDDLDAALELFAKIKDQVEGGEGDKQKVWKFKSLKQLMKIHYQLNHMDDLMKLYKELLNMNDYIEDKNYFLSSLVKIIDRYGKSNNPEFLEKFIELPLAHPSYLNDKLFIKLNIAKLNFLEGKNDGENNLSAIDQLIDLVIEKCEETTNEYTKKQHLLETYSIQLKILLSMSDIGSINSIKKLRNTFKKCNELEHNIIAHPKILGVINEAQGKLLMIERDFHKSVEILMESFKNYDESGSNVDKSRILKNLIVLNLLNLKSEVSILQSNEIKPYLRNSDDEDIDNLMKLLKYYEDNDISSFHQLIADSESTKEQFITKDDYNFLKIFKGDIINSINYKSLNNFFKSFSALPIDFLCKVLNIDNKLQLEELVFDMISEDILLYDIKFDYVSSTILVSNDSNNPLIPPQLKYIDIIANLKNYNQKDIASKLLIAENIDKLSIESIREWLIRIQSSIPAVSKEKLTQNEKVQLEKSFAIKKVTSERGHLDFNDSLNIVTQDDKLSSLLVRNLKLCSSDQQRKVNSSSKVDRFQSLIALSERLDNYQNTIFNDADLTYVPN